MAQIKPQTVANKLVEIGSNAESIRLSEVLLASLESVFPWMSEEQRLEYTEEHEENIARELYSKIETFRQDAIHANFEISFADDEYFIRFTDRPEIRLLRTLQNNPPIAFEHFCKNILTKLEGDAAVVGGVDDGGIDFWSSDLRLSNLAISSTKGSQILVVGQAKRYADGNHVTEVELRKFVGGSIRKIDELKRTRREQFGVLQPTILAFWTTSDFHRGARDYARDLGIWYLNGLALCQLALKLGLDANELTTV